MDATGGYDSPFFISDSVGFSRHTPVMFEIARILGLKLPNSNSDSGMVDVEHFRPTMWRRSVPALSSPLSVLEHTGSGPDAYIILGPMSGEAPSALAESLQELRLVHGEQRFFGTDLFERIRIIDFSRSIDVPRSYVSQLSKAGFEVELLGGSFTADYDSKGSLRNLVIDVPLGRPNTPQRLEEVMRLLKPGKEQPSLQPLSLESLNAGYDIAPGSRWGRAVQRDGEPAYWSEILGRQGISRWDVMRTGWPVMTRDQFESQFPSVPQRGWKQRQGDGISRLLDACAACFSGTHPD